MLVVLPQGGQIKPCEPNNWCCWVEAGNCIDDLVLGQHGRILPYLVAMSSKSDHSRAGHDLIIAPIWLIYYPNSRITSSSGCKKKTPTRCCGFTKYQLENKFLSKNRTLRLLSNYSVPGQLQIPSPLRAFTHDASTACQFTTFHHALI